ncbi:MAG: MFS transporter [Clostridiales bacterium]|jgi:melibiose permease/lactose/raffinose/galactose permease|nr:MFS transporter [Clostridiales bacterium]
MAKQKTKELISDPIEAQRVKTFNRNKWFFSLGGIGRDMSYQLVSAFLLTYVQFGVSLELAQFTTLSLIIGVGGRIWDAINDPLMGAIIDGSHLKWGKFKPWILIGAISCGAIILLMFNLRVWTGWDFVIFMVVVYLLWETTFTMNDIGYWAMLPSLSSKEKERNQVTMLTVVFAGLGAFIGQGLVIFFTPGNVVKGYSIISAVIVAAFIGCQLFTVLGVKETPREETEKEAKISLRKMLKTIKNNDQLLWMTLSLMLYSTGSGLLVALAYNLYYLEVGYDNKAFYFIIIFGICSIVANAVYPKLAERLGRKKLQLISALVAIIGYAGLGLIGWFPNILPFTIVTMSLFGLLVFLGQTLFYMATIINMTNCVEYNAYKQGERNEAVVSTLRPFVAKFSSAMIYGIVTLVLAVSGVFVLSQNISHMESQKSFLAGMDTATEQTTYIQNVNGYIATYNASADKEAVVTQLEAQIVNDDMSKYQVKADQIKALGDCVIYRTTIIDEKAGEPEKLGFLKDITAEQLKTDVGNTKYVYTMEIYKEGSFNAANVNFKDQGSIGMRLWLRVAVCGLPILLIALALLVQNRKFKIDEKYYQHMLKVLEDRDPDLSYLDIELPSDDEDEYDYDSRYFY